MPTELTTTNNALRYPTSANNGANFGLGIADLAADVDGMWLSGTFAAIPAAGKVNRRYYATDLKQWYLDTGAAWVQCAPPFVTGTAANRSTALPSPTLGQAYYATDTGVWSQYNGSAWGTVLVAGAWSALTLAGGVSAAAGSYTPSARIEGDIVRLKGVIQNTTGGGITAGTTLATLPAGTTPGSNAPIESYSPTSILTVIQATTGGVLSLITAGGSNWAASGTFNLNGKTYTLS